MERLLIEIAVGFLKGLAVSVSIGLSDAIELKTNPAVHLEHNCPDIARKAWKNYTYADAFMTGWICAYGRIIPVLVLLPASSTVIAVLCVFNLLVPVFVMPWQRNNIYLGHIVLYAANLVFIFVALVAALIGTK